MNIKESSLIVLKIFTLFYVLYFSLFFLGPIKYPFSSYIFVLIFIFIIGMTLAIMLANVIPFKKVTINKNYLESDQIKILKILKYLSIVYISIMIFDHIIDGNILEIGILNNRQELILGGRRGSIIGILKILLAGTPAVLAASLMLVNSKIIKRREYIILIVIATSGIATFFLSGGRNPVAITLIILYFVRYLKGKRNLNTYKLKLKLKFLIGALTLTIFYVFIVIFIARAELHSYDLMTSLVIMKDYFRLELYTDGFEIDFFNSVYFAFTMFFFYYNHSFSVFSEYLYTGFEDFTYGVMTFYLGAMFIDTFFSTSLYLQAIDALILDGVYLPLIGIAYIDFGEIGVFLSAFILTLFAVIYLSKSLSVNVASGAYFITMISAATLLSAFALAPMYNIISGFGLSIIIALVMAIVILKLTKIKYV